MADTTRLTIPEEALRAAMWATRSHFEMPYMARVRDFTPRQIAYGELSVAEEEAARQNREAVADVLAAAAPLIVAAELDRLVDETDWAWAVGSSLKTRAAELRGGAS